MVKTIKVMLDNVEKEIKLNNPTGGETKKGYKLLASVNDYEDEEKITAIDKYNDFVEEMAINHTGLSSEELDSLDCDSSHEILSHYASKIMQKFDFLKSSLM